ncbi:hypothetical protein [Neomoorella mulderi]|uniref:Cyclophilin-like domain-containing protein n=1 Tax=Moorella mulderi DSM 14980 TaxID=1122241 RepID=A0A151B0I9_9FIRM|nr:hypothetical protein [Moorella mulderi]KYH33302.1 hypothetical protein MOMUL_00030 [Moorella mulderi DSM 14980]
MRKKLLVLALLVVLTVVLAAGQAFAGTGAQPLIPAASASGQAGQGQAQQAELTVTKVGTVTVGLPLTDEAAKRYGPDVLIQDLPLYVTDNGTLVVFVPQELDVFGKMYKVVCDRKFVDLAELRYLRGDWLELPFTVNLE